ncbi:hypothetical protein AYO47_06980 [Planctomyces sp. SCGC AG-212-M04]|nr:hypothetical protein AYO47_06980 [Planctomyces sp. SCGC AG-212-M04]
MPTHIVGVGASAGGLEALERMFEQIPADTGMAFVVVQHLSPDFRSLMDELLARWTRMRIHRVEDRMPVEANNIYLIPPRKEMVISEGRLLLTDKDLDHGLSLPIDNFLKSLAQERGPTAIAVILSGTGSDGSRGVEEVKRAGGLVIAQSTGTAKFDGMPNAARETGMVDLILDPEDVGPALVRYAQHGDVQQLSEELQPPVADEDGLTAIYRLLRDRFGLDFSHYKLNTIVRRTERRLQLNHLDSVQDYARRLATDPEELDLLYRDLLVGVTRFFRDEEAYHNLEAQLREQLSRKPDGSEFRVWIAGCGTGEEAYSLAILLHDLVKQEGRSITLRVFATDVHRYSLEVAGEGIYRAESLSELPPDRVDRHFRKLGENYIVSPEIRQSIVFAPHNVIKDAPFTRMDLISCRNLLIYLQPPAQKKAVSLFHFGLVAGGLLFLGPSESPGGLDDEFEIVDARWKIYRKRRDVRLPIEIRAPAALAVSALRASGLPELAGVATRGPEAALVGTYESLLTEFMPPALLISEQHELLHVFGTAGRFLHYRPGRAGKDVLDLLDSRLRLAVVGAIQQVHVKRKPVKLHGIDVQTETGQERIAIAVRSVANPRNQTSALLVVFDAMPTVAGYTQGNPPSPIDEQTNASTDQLEALESELRYARENLQATVEELETSNEELQATNEELVASNEELQSSNEELQSVNEELYTVNVEHQRKIHELTVLTDDMDNLLSSTRVHTIFLDRELRIRKFTPNVAQIFNFVAADIGRPFDNFSHRLRRDRLAEEVQGVLQSGQPFEVDVEDLSGQWELERWLEHAAS